MVIDCNFGVWAAVCSYIWTRGADAIWIGTLAMFNFFVVAAVLDDYAECVVVKDSDII